MEHSKQFIDESLVLWALGLEVLYSYMVDLNLRFLLSTELSGHLAAPSCMRVVLEEVDHKVVVVEELPDALVRGSHICKVPKMRLFLYSMAKTSLFLCSTRGLNLFSLTTMSLASWLQMAFLKLSISTPCTYQEWCCTFSKSEALRLKPSVFWLSQEKAEATAVV